MEDIKALQLELDEAEQGCKALLEQQPLETKAWLAPIPASTLT